MRRNLLKVFICAVLLTMGVQVANAQEVYKQNGVTVGTQVDPATQKQQEQIEQEKQEAEQFHQQIVQQIQQQEQQESLLYSRFLDQFQAEFL